MDPWLTVAVGAGATLLAGIIGVWGGLLVARRGRQTDIDRSVGRLEGRIDRPRDQDSGRADFRNAGGDNLFLMIGGLQSDVRNLVQDVAEIKNNQETFRAAARSEHQAGREALRLITHDVKTTRELVDKLKEQFARLSASVHRLTGKNSHDEEG